MMLEGFAREVRTDGRLWFTTASGLAWIDPDHIATNPIRPSVVIKSMKADGRTYRNFVNLMLPKRIQNLQIDYTALSLSMPERVRFRYKLEGFDREWVDADTKRQAFYSQLPPGDYRFRVIASNNDGLWNETGDSLDFNAPPAFLQTVWFKLTSAMAIAGLLWTFYLIRLRQVTGRIRARLYGRLQERERIARDLHDTFFQGIQGLLLRFHTATSQLPKAEPTRQVFEEALKQSDQVMLEGRELVLDLRATNAETSDLPNALAISAKELQSIYAVEFKVIVNGDPRPLHPIVYEESYRIAKEALGNAFRHSKARAVEAELNYEPNELRVRVRDDGVGIDSKVLEHGFRAGHWGLPGMRERAQKIGAHLDIWSQLGRGTEIELRIPAAIAYRSTAKRPRLRWLRQAVEEREESQ